MIKQAHPQLQEYDLKAIYRRLVILHDTASSSLIYDYKYLKKVIIKDLNGI